MDEPWVPSGEGKQGRDQGSLAADFPLAQTASDHLTWLTAGKGAGALRSMEVPPLTPRLAHELDLPQHDVSADSLAHVVQGEGSHGS